MSYLGLYLSILESQAYTQTGKQAAEEHANKLREAGHKSVRVQHTGAGYSQVSYIHKQTKETKTVSFNNGGRAA